MRNNRVHITLLAGLMLLITTSCLAFTAARGPIRFSPSALPDAQSGSPYTVKISITDNATPAGEVSLSEGALPKGLTLEKVAGEDAARITGMPQEAGNFKFKIYVWCYGTNVSGQTGEKEYTLIVR